MTPQQSREFAPFQHRYQEARRHQQLRWVLIELAIEQFLDTTLMQLQVGLHPAPSTYNSWISSIQTVRSIKELQSPWLTSHYHLSVYPSFMWILCFVIVGFHVLGIRTHTHTDARTHLFQAAGPASQSTWHQHYSQVDYACWSVGAWEVTDAIGPQASFPSSSCCCICSWVWHQHVRRLSVQPTQMFLSRVWEFGSSAAG